MKKLILLILPLMLISCASTPKKEKPLTIQVPEQKELSTQIQTIQINTNNEPVLVTLSTVKQKLDGIIFHNNQDEKELSYQYNELKRCQEDLADPRLGSIKVTIPEIRTEWTPKVEEKVVTIGDQVYVIKEEPINDRLSLENEKSNYLEKTIPEIKVAKNKCETTMGQARRKAGLPPRRYQGIIDISSDGKVSKTYQRNEFTLDDAFEIKAELGN